MTQIWSPDIAPSYEAGGASDASFRNVCKSISGGGAQVRATLKGPLKCDNLFIGISGIPPATTTVPVELKIGAQSGCNLASGQQVVTDWADLAVSFGQTLIVGGDNSPNFGLYLCNPPYWLGYPECPNCDRWWSAGDTWNVQSPTMNNSPGLVVAVMSIEAQTPSGATGLVNIEKMPFAIASSVVDPASEAFGGGTEQRWSGAEIGSVPPGVSGIAWLGQDFGEARDIRKITVEQQTSSSAVSSVKVQYSDNGTAWTDAGTFAISADSSLNTLEFSAGAHRFWRLLANSNPTNPNDRWQVMRMRMFAPVNTVPKPEPKFQAYLKPVLAPFPTAVMTTIPWDATFSDSDGSFDPVTHRHVPTRLGWYRYHIAVCLTGNITRMDVYPMKYYPDKGHSEAFVLPWRTGPGLFEYVINIPMVNPGEYMEITMLVQGTDVNIEGHKCWFEATWEGE